MKETTHLTGPYLPGGGSSNRVAINLAQDGELAFFVGRLADRLAALVADKVTEASGARVAMLSREVSKAVLTEAARLLAHEYARQVHQRLGRGHPLTEAVLTRGVILP